jgi:hypothetical protein
MKNLYKTWWIKKEYKKYLNKIKNPVQGMTEELKYKHRNSERNQI